MISGDQLSHSKAIQQQTGPTFHIATRLLPQRIRHATYVLYAFFRVADDVVDDPDPAPAAVQRSELDRIRFAALGDRPTDDPVLAAFADVRETHDIADREVNVFIDAMLQDVAEETQEQVVFEDNADRTAYLRGSAVAVAYMMLTVMDPEDAATARPHARALGEAFQLTNFLRDVREDIVEYNRIYLPQETINRTGLDIANIVAHNDTPASRTAIQADLSYAEGRYRKGVAGIQHLPKRCQFPVLMAAIFYAEYHRLIREVNYRVLQNPPSLSRARYARLFAQASWHWLRTKDPSTVFYRVSPIDPLSQTGPQPTAVLESDRQHPPMHDPQNVSGHE